MEQMSQADIFCLPSWQEGFGIVYIEAMSQGVPVIAVQGEGIEDVIVHEQNGLLVRPHDPEDVAKALESLFSNPAYASELGEAGRQAVLDGLTWERNAKMTLGLYKQLCGKNTEVRRQNTEEAGMKRTKSNHDN